MQCLLRMCEPPALQKGPGGTHSRHWVKTNRSEVKDHVQLLSEVVLKLFLWLLRQSPSVSQSSQTCDSPASDHWVLGSQACATYSIWPISLLFRKPKWTMVCDSVPHCVVWANVVHAIQLEVVTFKVFWKFPEITEEYQPSVKLGSSSFLKWLQQNHGNPWLQSRQSRSPQRTTCHSDVALDMLILQKVTVMQR